MSDESRYRVLFEESPISLWEEDFSAVKQRVDELCQDCGRENLAAHLQDHPDAVRECSQKIRVLDINRTTLRMYNAPSKEALLQKLDAVFGEDVNGILRQEMLAISRGEVRFDGEGVNHKYSGEAMDIALQWSVAPGCEDTYGRVFVSIQDNTRRKQAETRLEAVFHNPRIAITLMDRDRHYLMFNRRWAEMLGYAPEELQQMDMLQITHPDDKEGSRQRYQALVEGHAQNYQVEKRYVRKDGSVFWADLTVVPIRGVDQEIEAVISFIMDISERRQMLLDLAQSQKMAILGTVAGGVAHEINTPLQVITGASDSILNAFQAGDTVDASQFRQKIEMISRNGWRVAEIVSALQDYVRPNAARFEAASLNQVVKDALQRVRHHFRTRPLISIITDLDEPIPPLACDRDKLITVITNLLTNARDALPRGGEIHICTAYDPTRRRLALVVKDSGHGIPPAIRDKIFDPFYTTKAPGEGVGLGLSVVQGIVRLHGGDIEVASAEGAGTQVTLYLPEDGPPPPGENPLELVGRYDDAV